METEYFFQKLDNNTNKKQIEVYFNEAGFTPLYKSNLKENSFYLFNEDFSVGDISKVNLKVDIEENRKIRIWTSHSNIHEYLSFLYICHKCPNNDISVIFTDDYEKNLYSLGAANYKEITKILKYEIHLIKKDIEKNNYGKYVKIYETEIPLAIKTAEASIKGKSIFEYDKKGTVANAYENLVEEVLEDEKQSI